MLNTATFGPLILMWADIAVGSITQVDDMSLEGLTHPYKPLHTCISSPHCGMTMAISS